MIGWHALWAAVQVAVSAVVPGAPTGVTATAGNTQAVINFTAPASDGGSAITGYTVTASPGGTTVSGSASPITFSGLNNGTAYTFTVRATNFVGQGATSTASAAVTPTGALLYVLAGANSVGRNEYTVSGGPAAYDSVASRVIGTVGSGDVTEINMILRGWLVSTTTSPDASNAVTYSAWVKAVGKTAVQVTWGGATTKVVSPGDLRVTADTITAVALGYPSGRLPRGTRVVVSLNAKVTNGQKVQTRNYVCNATGQFFGIPYNSATCNITNFATGESGFAWSGINLTSILQNIPVEIVGRYADSDKTASLLAGDSISEGEGSGSTSCFAKGSLASRASFATDADPTSLAISGCNASCSSGTSAAWGDATKLGDLCKLANVLVEGYAINNISYSGGQALADSVYASSKSIWDLFKAQSATTNVRTPKVIRWSVLAKTNSAGTTPQAGCGVGETLDLLCQKFVARATADGFTYVNMRGLGAFLSNDTATADNYKWNVTYAADGLHPTDAGHALFATQLRTAIFAA